MESILLKVENSWNQPIDRPIIKSDNPLRRYNIGVEVFLALNVCWWHKIRRRFPKLFALVGEAFRALDHCWVRYLWSIWLHSQKYWCFCGQFKSAWSGHKFFAVSASINLSWPVPNARFVLLEIRRLPGFGCLCYLSLLRSKYKYWSLSSPAATARFVNEIGTHKIFCRG